ncbi:MAG: glycosyltransferase [Gallionellaceae bacterium]|nr:glycosyltransferase [Gallionellaceae bacterium]
MDKIDQGMSESPGAPTDRHSRCRVLVVAHDAMLYGAQHSLLDILSHIDGDRYEPYVVIPSSGPFTDALGELGISSFPGLAQRWIFFPKPMTSRAILRRPWRRLNHPYVLSLLSWVSLPVRVLILAYIVRRNKISLIYTNTATVLDGAFTARLCRIPHVWHLRERVADNHDLSSPLPVGWIAGFALNWSAAVITNSYALARTLFGAAPPEKVKVVHNGVDLSRFTRPTFAIDLPGVPEAARLTAVCGALQKRKDILTYIRSAARLRDLHPDLHHLVIGQGHMGYRLLIEQEIARLGLRDRVHLLGYRDDVPTLLSRIDVMVSTSIHEPFGRTLIEAMAAGKPVVATRSGGPEEIIVDGECGFLVEIGDDVAIAEVISRLLDDKALYEAMSQSARERVFANFDLQSSVSKIERTFDGVLLDHQKV